MYCAVTLIANAGVMLECNGKKVLIDPLHNIKTPSFSVVPPEMIECVFNSAEFAEPDIVIATHKHPDHYARGLMAEELKHYPNAAFFAPFEDFENMNVITGKRMSFEVSGVNMEFFRAPHDGRIYEHVPNYACILDFGGYRVLDVADTQTGNDEMCDWAAEKNIDLAILTFPWYVLHHGRKEVDNVIKPRNIALVHFPFEYDDNDAFTKATIASLKKLPPSVETKLFTEAGQKEIFS